MPKVIKCQFIEVINPGVAGSGNGSVKIQFQDQPYLRNKKILGIETFTALDISQTPTGKTPQSGAQMKQGFVTFYLNDIQNPNNVGEWLQNVPLTILHRVQNNVIPATSLPNPPNVQFSEPFVRSMFELQRQVIYWEKCYISLAAALNNTTDVSFPFMVYFED